MLRPISNGTCGPSATWEISPPSNASSNCAPAVRPSWSITRRWQTTAASPNRPRKTDCPFLRCSGVPGTLLPDLSPSDLRPGPAEPGAAGETPGETGSDLRSDGYRLGVREVPPVRPGEAASDLDRHQGIRFPVPAGSEELTFGFGIRASPIDPTRLPLSGSVVPLTAVLVPFEAFW